MPETTAAIIAFVFFIVASVGGGVFFIAYTEQKLWRRVQGEIARLEDDLKQERRKLEQANAQIYTLKNGVLVLISQMAKLGISPEWEPNGYAPSPEVENELSNLAEQIADLFNESDLNVLAFNMSAPLTGNSHHERVISLVTHADQRGNIDSLIARLKKARPRANWPVLLLVFMSLLLLALAPVPPVAEYDPLPYKQHLPIVQRPFEYPPSQTMIGFAYASIGSRMPYEIAQMKPQWFHVWSIGHTDYETGIERVQHLSCDRRPYWNYGSSAQDQFALAHDVLGSDYNGRLIFLNEPDLFDQCETTPTQAAFMLRSLQEQFPQAIIIGPQPSHFDYQNNWEWMRGFYNSLAHYQIAPPDIAAYHTYINSEHPSLITDSLFDMLAGYENAPKTAWVTEMGSANPDRVKQMIRQCYEDTRIERCAWFTPREIDYDWPSVLYRGQTPLLTDAGAAWVEMMAVYQP